MSDKTHGCGSNVQPSGASSSSCSPERKTKKIIQTNLTSFFQPCKRVKLSAEENMTRIEAANDNVSITEIFVQPDDTVTE